MQGASLAVSFLLSFLGGLLYRQPLLMQHVDIALEVLLRGPLSSSANYHPGVTGNNILENAFQALALRIGQLTGNSGAASVRHVHQVTSSH